MAEKRSVLCFGDSLTWGWIPVEESSPTLPKLLIVSPPPLAPMPDPWFEGMFGGGYEKSLELAKHYKALANFLKVDFLDAGEFVKTDGCDGIRFSAATTITLGKAIAEKVNAIFSQEATKTAA
ncbi:hypothetical protein [Pseudorhizobium flavum]|uniref:hypothetical protein n=1 Tax=Pseudorhizobium flavum TaxID=1335061 RepID=UPI00248F520A|nr:hypothetical protein [Pseudorhizobium flavum]